MSGYIQVTVDAQDVLDEVDDDDLLDEVANRKLSLDPYPDEPDYMNLIQDTYDALMRGHYKEAEVILDRLLHPKWRTGKECVEQYVKAQGKPAQASSGAALKP